MFQFDHEDRLLELEKTVGVGRKLGFIHKTLKTHIPLVSRIAATLYDARTDTVKTYAHSSDEDEPLEHYEAKLSTVPSLKQILIKRRARVVNDMSIFHSKSRHTRHLRAQGNRSSYTIPMYEYGIPFGFLFFNSRKQEAFTEEALKQLDPYGHLVTQSIINEQKAVRNLLATVKTARDFNHIRDDETAEHQDRMSRFARLIAQKLAPKYAFSDEFIENIFLFSPLHDIGKLGIPDHILFKPAALTEDEFAIMKTHTTKGRQFVDQLLTNFSLDAMPHVQILRNIAEFHHESIDGHGYPQGRKYQDIPIEARITTVADVFDALTSRRPYKLAWSNDEAYAKLDQLSGTKLDPDCIAVLVQCRQEVETIQRQFRKDAGA